MKFIESNFYRILAWGLAGLFFMLHYIVRVAPQEINPFLQVDFSLTMTQITLMQTSFLVSYITMQVPAGLLLDRYAPHRVLQGAVFLVLLSTFILYEANSFGLLLVSRVLLGLGSAFAFSGSVKIATLWFPRQFLGFLTSLTQVLGMIGAASQVLIDDALSIMSWRSAAGIYTLIMLAIWVLMLLVWQDHPDRDKVSHTRSTSYKAVLIDFAEAMKNQQTWLVALYTGFIFAPTLIFGESIGKNYLTAVLEDFTSHQDSTMISIIFVGFAVGGIFQGLLSDMLGTRRPSLFFSSAGSLLTFTTYLYAPINYYLLCLLCFLYGFANSGLVIGYALAGEINPRRISGAGIAFANMMSVLVGTILLSFMGMLLDYFKSVQISDKLAYEYTFAICPICLLISFVLAFYIHESFCRSVDERL